MFLEEYCANTHCLVRPDCALSQRMRSDKKAVFYQGYMLRECEKYFPNGVGKVSPINFDINRYQNN